MFNLFNLFTKRKETKGNISPAIPPMVVEHKSINIFHGVCPMCVAQPVEYLTVEDYGRKYPAIYHLQFGYVHVWLCKVHAKELLEELRKPIPIWEDDWVSENDAVAME